MKKSWGFGPSEMVVDIYDLKNPLFNDKDYFEEILENYTYRDQNNSQVWIDLDFINTKEKYFVKKLIGTYFFNLNKYSKLLNEKEDIKYIKDSYSETKKHIENENTKLEKINKELKQKYEKELSNSKHYLKIYDNIINENKILLKDLEMKIKENDFFKNKDYNNELKIKKLTQELEDNKAINKNTKNLEQDLKNCLVSKKKGDDSLKECLYQKTGEIQKNADISNKIILLQQQIAKHTSVIKTLDNSYNTINNEKENLQKQILSIQNEKQKIEDLIEDKNTNIEKLKEEVEKLKNEIEILQEKIKLKDSRYDTLILQLNKSKALVIEKENKIIELENHDKNNLKDYIQDAKRMYSNYEKQIEDLKLQIQNKKEEIQKLNIEKQKISNYLIEIQSLKNKIEEIQHENNRIEELEKEISDYQYKIIELLDIIEGKDTQIKKIGSEKKNVMLQLSAAKNLAIPQECEEDILILKSQIKNNEEELKKMYELKKKNKELLMKLDYEIFKVNYEKNELFDKLQECENKPNLNNKIDFISKNEVLTFLGKKRIKI